MCKISEELMKNYWIVCGYKSIDELQNEEGSIHRAMTYLEIPENNQRIDHAAGQDAITALNNPENELGDPEAEGMLESIWDVIEN